jgi:hypothetical protein
MTGVGVGSGGWFRPFLAAMNPRMSRPISSAQANHAAIAKLKGRRIKSIVEPWNASNTELSLNVAYAKKAPTNHRAHLGWA